MKKRLLQVITFIFISILIISCQTIKITPDYSNPENWAYYAEGIDKDVDLFLICPTVDMGEKGPPRRAALNVSYPVTETYSFST